MLQVVLSSTSRLIHLVVGTPMACRFEPSCSKYAAQSFQQHGIFKGAWLTCKRVCRCNPWGGTGYDPVPASERGKTNGF